MEHVAFCSVSMFDLAQPPYFVSAIHNENSITQKETIAPASVFEWEETWNQFWMWAHYFKKKKVKYT